MRVIKPIGFDSWPELEKRKWFERIEAEQKRFIAHVKTKMTNIRSQVKVEKKQKPILDGTIISRELRSIRAIFGAKLRETDED